MIILVSVIPSGSAPQIDHAGSAVSCVRATILSLESYPVMHVSKDPTRSACLVQLETSVAHRRPEVCNEDRNREYCILDYLVVSRTGPSQGRFLRSTKTLRSLIAQVYGASKF